MKEIMLSNTGNICQIDDEDFMFVLGLSDNWRESPEGYAYCYIKGKKIYMSIEIGKRKGLNNKGFYIDHEDRNKLNNQRYNLRQATQSEQNINMGLRKDNTLGYKGIFKNGKGWAARYNYQGVQYNLGTYDTIEEAVEVRKKAVKRRYGNFADRDNE